MMFGYFCWYACFMFLLKNIEGSELKTYYFYQYAETFFVYTDGIFNRYCWNYPIFLLPFITLFIILLIKTFDTKGLTPSCIATAQSSEIC